MPHGGPLAEAGEALLELGQRHRRLLAAVEIAQAGDALRQLVLAQDDGRRRAELVGALQPLAQIAAIAELDGEARPGAAVRPARRPALGGRRRPARPRRGRRAGGVSASIMASRSMPAAQPTPGVGGPPMMLDQPVIAPAAPAPCPGRPAPSVVNSKAVWQ